MIDIEGLRPRRIDSTRTSTDVFTWGFFIFKNMAFSRAKIEQLISGTIQSACPGGKRAQCVETMIQKISREASTFRKRGNRRITTRIKRVIGWIECKGGDNYGQ